MRTGVANLPLHGHHCPRWLFDRMMRLSSAIVEAIVEEYGPGEVLRRVSDPFWFQALGCVTGFDWHSSGLTTVLCGALKEGLRHRGPQMGLFIAGGKAMVSRKTPNEIEEFSDKHGLTVDVRELQHASRMSAKVDNSALQDGFQIYHHVFFFTGKGKWAVVQQGMNSESGWARRYHWLGDSVTDFVQEPHTGISGPGSVNILNLVAAESSGARSASLYLARENPAEVVKVLRRLNGMAPSELKKLQLPAGHPVPNASRIEKSLNRIYGEQPGTYSLLLATEGVGPATLRAYALTAEVVYGVKASRRDPVKYSFAHGGKDGHPFPVNRARYDDTIMFLERAVKKARMGRPEGMQALKKLSEICEGRFISQI